MYPTCISICHLSQVFGSAVGGDEIILLCDKVDKSKFTRIYLDCHPLPMRGVVDGTRTRKPGAYLLSRFLLTIYLPHYPLHLLLTHALFEQILILVLSMAKLVVFCS